MGVDLAGSHRSVDQRQHEETYANFRKLVLGTIAICVITLALMAIFLT